VTRIGYDVYEFSLIIQYCNFERSFLWTGSSYTNCQSPEAGEDT